MLNETGLLNKVLTGVMMLALGWIFTTVQRTDITVAVLTAQVQGLTATIEASTKDRYTRSEALSDGALTKQRLERLEQWAERLSDRVRDVEAKTD